MRLHLLMAVTALSLTRCSFDATGLNTEGSGVATTTAGETTTSDATTNEPTTTTSSPTSTTDEPPGDCGNSQLDGDEECDNGELNNGMSGSVCKGDCTLNVCGDGYVASSEGCDDGNQVDDDGCSNACKSANCGDGVKGPDEQCDDGNQVDTDECTNLCKTPFCGDGNLGAGEACDDGANNSLDKACLPDCKQNICGDGNVLVGIEPCDDGNQVDDDECTNACALPGCGDGVKQPNEECDDGNDNEDACTNMCKLPICGDTIINMAMGEECDLGAGNNGDDKACTAACKNNVCHDGHQLVGTEECDDGNTDNADACVGECKNAVCGDTFVQAGTEQCDDGNMNNGDMCTSTCSLCGNGMIDSMEECDDANMDGGDTCSPMCKRLAYMAFVTSVQYTGNLGGYLEADKKCNALATTSKLPGAGTYLAWLSVDPSVDPEDDNRFAKVAEPYIRVDKQTIATSWADLVDGDVLVNALDRTDTGGQVSANKCEDGNGLVWTATLPNGDNNGNNDCNDWFDTNASAPVGFASKVDGQWTAGMKDGNNCTPSCNTMARLYCFEQPPG